MAKKGYKRLISPLSVNLKNFSLYYKSQDGTETYRCLYCFKCRIKKVKNLFFRFTGHHPKCCVINKNNNKIKKMNKISKKIKILGGVHNNFSNNNTNFHSKNIKASTENKIITEEFPLKENENFALIKNFIIYKKKIIGEGSFTKTDLGFNQENQEDVAVKISKEKKQFSSILIESAVLEKLKSKNNFPKVKAMFKYNSKDVVIETLLGPNLRKLLEFNGKMFEISTIFLIAISVLKKLEVLHREGILHNDLKLSNLAWGIINNGKIKKDKEIFILDFGLATRFKFFKNENGNKNKDYRHDEAVYSINNKKNTIGNLKFMSKDVLLGKTPCPRTELESFLYLIIYLIKRKLPWSGIRGKNHVDKKNKYIECHLNTTNKDLCNKIPYQIAYIYYNVIELKDNEQPKYKYYLNILKEFLCLNQIQDNIDFCWKNKIISEEERGNKISVLTNLLLDI